MSTNVPFELPVVTAAPAPPREDRQRAARMAVVLSWASLAYMGVEGGVGVWQGAVAGSIALVGWGLASFIEGAASAVIVWRFTGARRHSDTAEQRAQKLVAIQFFILAPYVLVESITTLVQGGHPDITVIGMALTATSVVGMPLLGRAKQHLAVRLDSRATAGEGTQNVLCGIQAAAVLVGLSANAAVGAWWLDPLIGMFIAFVAIREGRAAWRGEACADCCAPLVTVDAGPRCADPDCCNPATDPTPAPGAGQLLVAGTRVIEGRATRACCRGELAGAGVAEGAAGVERQARVPRAGHGAGTMHG